MIMDTNAIVWVRLDDRRLGPRTRFAIAQAVWAREARICPISYGEVGMAAARGRLVLGISLEQWRIRLITDGYRELVVTARDVLEAHQLKDFHGDPADRLIVAVARNRGLTLVTSDRKILSWPGQLSRLNSRE